MTTVFTTAVACFLCKANVPFSTTDQSRLLSHLEGEHMAFFGTDYLVAGCTMSGEERAAIQKVVKGRQPKLIQLAPEESEEELEVMEEGQVGHCYNGQEIYHDFQTLVYRTASLYITLEKELEP